MKKIIVTGLVCLVCLTAVFAFDFSFKNFTFKPVSINPLYESYKADSWNFDTRGQVIKLLDGKDLHQVLVCTKYEAGREEYYYNWDEIEQPISEEYIHEYADFREEGDGLQLLYRVKTGFGVGLLRTSYKKFSVEGAVQGAINLVFDAQGGTDCIGFDGIYFLGLNAKYSDFVSARFGYHHYSGHYGDEIEEDFMLRTDEKGRKYSDRFSYDRSNGGYISRLTQYVRQDSLIAGLSVTPFSWLRLYGEIDFPPKKMKNIRPWVLVPNGVYASTSDTGATMQTHNGCSEGIYPTEDGERKYAYSDSYKALSVNWGVELSHDFKNIGTVLLAYDMKLNQEGQTMYQIGAYKETNPWDVDHNVLLSFSFEDMPVSAEVIYHNGRFPLMNFYWYHCSYVSVGFSISN